MKIYGEVDVKFIRLAMMRYDKISVLFLSG